ncbi:MAG: class E sortase [Actinobacteria bacterium]|nr:class E sortase [Actinomycetota bacterium]
MKQPRKRYGKPLKVFGIVLIIAGLGVLLYIPATWVMGYFAQRGLPAEFDQESASALSLNQSVLGKMQGAAETEKIRELAKAFQKQLHSEQTIARLEIPRIGINAIVVEGTTDSSLRKGVGHMEDTPLPGMGENFSLAGDRVLYGAPFLNIDDLSEGDDIHVKTTYAEFNYTVVSKRITTPDDTAILNSPGFEAVTLITCDPPWDTSHRLVVQGKLTSASLLNSGTS